MEAFVSLAIDGFSCLRSLFFWHWVLKNRCERDCLGFWAFYIVVGLLSAMRPAFLGAHKNPFREWDLHCHAGGQKAVLVRRWSWHRPEVLWRFTFVMLNTLMREDMSRLRLLAHYWSECNYSIQTSKSDWIYYSIDHYFYFPSHS